MKTHLRRTPSLDGNVLLVSLVTIIVVGTLLAAYLSMVRSQNSFTMRSQAWNACMPVIEAGIEEALAHLNHNSNNLAVNGWTLNAAGGFTRTRHIDDAYYQVTITFTNIQWPTIISRGHVPAPVTVASGYQPIFASLSLNLDRTQPSYIFRTVRVTAARQPLFKMPLFGKDGLSFSGNNILTDSFDSSNPARSGSNGQYDPNKASDNGDVGSNFPVTTTGNAKIKGQLLTGPGANFSPGPNGVIGSAKWHTDGNTGVEPGYFQNDMNVQLEDIQAPWTGGALVPISSGNQYTLLSGNWELNSLTLSSKDRMMVEGHAVLYVKGDVKISGGGYIEIRPGASLTLYVGGSTSISGNGIANKTGLATSFTYYGLPTNKDISISGNSEFIGAVYAPSADLKLNGGGSSVINCVGAFVAKSITMVGDYAFHFDEALLAKGATKGYVVTSWDEI